MALECKSFLGNRVAQFRAARSWTYPLANRMTFAIGTTASAALCSSQQPRVTCYQARIRMNEPHDLATVLSLIARGVVFMVPGHKPST